MTIFAKATMPLAPKNLFVVRVGLVYAVILVVLAVAQLFSFETFLPLVASFGLPGGQPAAYLLATVIVIAEVFALPFLLRMQVSTVMRVFSMVMGWLVVLIWLCIASWLALTDSTAGNVGLLGDVVTVVPGWALTAAVIMGGLTAWASWGMWPPAVRK